MGRIALQNGPFRSVKRPVLQCETVCFAIRWESVRYVGANDGLRRGVREAA